MPTYRYSSAGIIDEATIVTNDHGAARAYLHAGSAATPAVLAQAKTQFAARGWHAVPMSVEGKPVLELRGFKDAQQLATHLQSQGLVQGAPTIQADAGDKKSLKDTLANKTLQGSGYAYLLGDTAFMAYASMELNKHYKGLRKVESALGGEKAIAAAKESVRGGWAKIGSGVLYAVGSLILAGYGSRDQSRVEIKKSVGQIDRFIRQEGLANPNGGSALIQEPEQKARNPLGLINAALKRFPSEALNIVYTGVGLLLMRASFKQIGSLNEKIKPLKALPAATEKLHNLKSELHNEMIDVGLGTITAASAIAGLTIKEKKPVEGEKRRTGFAGVWDWIQEKPLRATGYGFMVATGVHAITTARKWKALPGESLAEIKDKRAILTGRGIFVALNVVAELLMAVSSKGHGEGVQTDRSTDDSVLAATAEFISRQPVERREVLVERLAGYMASPEVMGQKAEIIAGRLREQLSTMEKNLWAATPTVSEAAPAAAPQQIEPGKRISFAAHDARLQALPAQATAVAM